jgi:hypothetical protein
MKVVLLGNRYSSKGVSCACRKQEKVQKQPLRSKSALLSIYQDVR